MCRVLVLKICQQVRAHRVLPLRIFGSRYRPPHHSRLPLYRVCLRTLREGWVPKSGLICYSESYFPGARLCRLIGLHGVSNLISRLASLPSPTQYACSVGHVRIDLRCVANDLVSLHLRLKAHFANSIPDEYVDSFVTPGGGRPGAVGWGLTPTLWGCSLPLLPVLSTT